MKICVDKVLKTLTGQELDAPEGESDGKLTLRTVITNALIAPTEENNKLSGQKKLEAWNLAQRVHTCNADGAEAMSVVELSAEEISTIKDSISKAWPIVVTGQAFNMLEQTVEEPAE